MDDGFPRCARCGDRIGVYERIWVRHPDGWLKASGFLQLRAGDVALPVQLFHFGCLAPGTAAEAERAVA